MSKLDWKSDWKKRAAAVLTDEETELAFMRQAFVFVESKARPLVREPYFIGFEVVEKNDASTNIIGLFVFRVEKKLLYAPAFYKNGEIRGITLLYNASEKLFVPLTPEWCNYYIGKHAEQDGSVVNTQNVQKHTRGINFNDLMKPTSLRKTASARTAEVWEEMKVKLGWEKEAAFGEQPSNFNGGRQPITGAGGWTSQPTPTAQSEQGRTRPEDFNWANAHVAGDPKVVAQYNWQRHQAANQGQPLSQEQVAAANAYARSIGMAFDPQQGYYTPQASPVREAYADASGGAIVTRADGTQERQTSHGSTPLGTPTSEFAENPEQYSRFTSEVDGNTRFTETGFNPGSNTPYRIEIDPGQRYQDTARDAAHQSRANNAWTLNRPGRPQPSYQNNQRSRPAMPDIASYTQGLPKAPSSSVADSSLQLPN